MRQVLSVVGGVAMMSDAHVHWLPIRLAQLRQGILRYCLVRVPACCDDLPAGGDEYPRGCGIEPRNVFHGAETTGNGLRDASASAEIKSPKIWFRLLVGSDFRQSRSFSIPPHVGNLRIMPLAASSLTANSQTKPTHLSPARPVTCQGCGRVHTSCRDGGPNICEQCLFDLALEPMDQDTSSAVEEQVPPPVGAEALGPYILIEEIGRGGMGIIYRAIHEETRQVVAVKTVLPQNASCAETLARFEREAEAVLDLVHAHLIPIYGVGRSGAGTPFIAMKMAVGGSLDGLREKYRGRWQQIAGLLIKIAAAVQHAHERGILHRDLKPGNILFTEDHEPLVTDFGLAKQLIASDGLTQSCAVLGTPNYVAPEQAAGKTRDLTAAADIYSLGAVLYELLTGRPPFVGDNPLDVLRQVASESPPRPRKLAPLVPKMLESICMRCLERRPEDRYATARDLGKDLQSWLQGGMIATRPRKPHFSRVIRGRGIIGAASGITVGLLAALWIGSAIAKRSAHFAASAAPIAVFIDDLDQGGGLETIASKAMGDLNTELADTAAFRPVGVVSPIPNEPGSSRDPLAFGRSTNAEVVLAGCVRRAGSNTRMVARLLRCDTGEVIWRHTENIPTAHLDACLPIACGTLAKSLVGRWRTGVDDLTRSLRYVPLPEAKTYYTRAMELAARSTRRDLEDAQKLFQHAAQIDPKFAPARAMLAFMLWTQAEGYEEWDKIPLAIAAASDALRIDPNSIHARRVIASCLLKDGRRQEALDVFWSTVEDDPQSAGACVALGICLRTMGHPGQAIPWMKRAVRLEPAHGAARTILSETLFLCGRDEEGEAVLNDAVHLESDRWEMPIDLGALRTWQKRFDEARQICAQTRVRFPDCRFGTTLSAWIEFCDGKDLAKAKTELEQLRAGNSYHHNWKFYGAINPTSALAHLAKQNGPSEQVDLLVGEALKEDQELLLQFQHNPRILHDLAATYSVAGDTEQALHYLQAAVTAGWVEYRSTQIDPRFSSIAKLPRFCKIVRIFP